MSLIAAMQPPPHSKRVEAWVYAIINPLVENLRREVFLLKKGNLSWRFRSRCCEYLRPISAYFPYSQLPNYEDFVADELNPGFKTQFDKHDGALARVENSASRFFDDLMRASPFLEQVKRTLKEYESKQRDNPLSPSLDSMKDYLAEYIAECLVNRAQTLPYHYMPHKFWERYGSEFEVYKEAKSFQKLKRDALSLEGISERLLPELESHRQTLCRKYDIPAAPVHAKNSQITDVFKP